MTVRDRADEAMAMEGFPQQPASSTERPAAWWWLAAVALVVALCWGQYYPLLGTWFHHDDFNWLRVAQGWQEAPASIVRGDTGVTVVFNALFSLAYQIGDWRDSVPYFVGLISLHALCSVLVIWLVYELTTDRAAALFAGIVFATAFVHHEAVGWIAAGLHVLMTVLLMLTLCLWLVRRRLRGSEYAGPVAGVLTVLAKDSGVILGPLALLVQHYSGAEPLQRVWRRMALWFGAPYVVLALWRVLLPPAREAIPIGGADYSFGPHLLTNAVLCVPQMIVPDLAFPNYHALLAAHLPAGLVGAAVTGSRVVLVLLSMAAAIGFWRGGRLVRLGIAWCYVAFLPFVAFSYDYARAPRYLHPASVGFALLAGLALAWLWRRARGAGRASGDHRPGGRAGARQRAAGANHGAEPDARQPAARGDAGRGARAGAGAEAGRADLPARSARAPARCRLGAAGDLRHAGCRGHRGRCGCGAVRIRDRSGRLAHGARAMSGVAGEVAGPLFLATPARRLAAAAIDVVVLVLAYAIVAAIGIATAAPVDGWPLWLTRALGLGYLLLGWGLWGQTVGKHVLRLQVVRAATGRPAMGAALVRLIGYVLASIPAHIGLLPILWHPRRQGWHDRLAGTVVIDLRGRGRPLAPAAQPGDAPRLELHPLRAGRVALAGGLYAVVAVVFTWPLLAQILTHRIGGPGHDGSLFMWTLWYFTAGRQVDPDPSWMHTLLFYWPHGVSLSFHTMVWLNGLVAQPLVRNLPLVTAYNVVLLGNMVLCSLGAYCLAQRFVRSPVAAWVGGLSFGLSPYFIAQAWLGHLSSVSLALLPWVAFGAVELGRTRWRLAAVLTELALAACAYMDYYLMVFGGLVLVSVAPVTGRLWGRTWGRIAAGMVLTLAVAAVGLAPLAAAIAHDIGRPVRQSLNWREGGSLSVGAFAAPNPLSRALRAARIEVPFTTREGAATAGMVLLGLAVVGGVTRAASLRPWLVVGVLALLIAAGPMIELGRGGLPQALMLLLGGPPGNGLGPTWDITVAYHAALDLLGGSLARSHAAPRGHPEHRLRPGRSAPGDTGHGGAAAAGGGGAAGNQRAGGGGYRASNAAVAGARSGGDGGGRPAGAGGTPARARAPLRRADRSVLRAPAG